ncbi:helix-turn-helix domain-containing protein [Paenibacillus campinasensis]|uniref:HTH cro/C1-type domain-containing protein n=1 Tax=Paenibacillus campinasensis TaxID=66347 RepID=A0A268EY92_9BACL|nr:helix-turn-helix transcriptional regulator [Paenibacillus campinasensis]PAD78092.1 hypothetical protein CHH67_07620 [Paenibacillus campinasensis]
MEEAATIRDHLAQYLQCNGMTINQFANRTGLNSGTISRIINHKQSISMGQLERITSGMNLPEDYFFHLYIDECLYYSASSWRRLHPFLLRCAELGRLDCIDQAARYLLDNLSYVPKLFEVAEALYHRGSKSAAALLYELVSESEKYQHSERLALCQYRLLN